jgi:hypothetical protein
MHATLVPEIFPQPPDLSYPTLWDNDAPLVLTHRFGRGRVVYLAGQTDRLNVTSGHPDHQRVLENALAWSLETSPPLVDTDAPPHVHVTVLRQPATSRLYLHLVNYSGARGRPVTAPFPAGDLHLSVDSRLTSSQPGQAALLVSGRAVPVTHARGRLSLTVPNLDRYEVVRID